MSAVGPVDSDFHLQHHMESLKGKGFDVTLETLKNAEIRLAASLAGLPDAQRLLHDVQRRLHGAWQAQRNSNLRPGAHLLTVVWHHNHAMRRVTYPEIEVPASVPEDLQEMARKSALEEAVERYRAGKLRSGKFIDPLHNIEVASFTWEWHQPEGFLP